MRHAASSDRSRNARAGKKCWARRGSNLSRVGIAPLIERRFFGEIGCFTERAFAPP
jgi:hypothetical protein